MRTLPGSAVLLTIVLATGCAGTDDDPTIQVPPTFQSSPPVAPTSTLSPGVDKVVRVAYAEGDVLGPRGRVEVRRGDSVQLLVTSDKADEVHLHGYDKSVDVVAGGTASLTFEAMIPGVFEVELERLGVVLVRLQVQ